MTSDTDLPDPRTVMGVALANHLLMEIDRGMRPVWPTTRVWAGMLADGLVLLSRTRPDEVARAVAVAPTGTHLKWQAILADASDVAESA